MNTRRQLDKLQELEMSSLDASIAMSNMSIIQEKTQNIAKSVKSNASLSNTAWTRTLSHKIVQNSSAFYVLINAALCLSTDVAGEERLKQLERWKERKALEKEKEKREKERKGVFKTGVYHHKDLLNTGSLPVAPVATRKTKEVRKVCEQQITSLSQSI